MAGECLADTCEIIMGQSPPGDSCNEDAVGLPLLNGPTEFGPYHPFPVQFTTESRKRAKTGDLLFCVRGSTTGRMNWADQEYAIGRGVAAIRHKKDTTLQPFVRAVIEYRLPDLLAQATGSTFPNVSGEQLASLWWPPLQLAEQRAIAHILGKLDDKIELNRRMNETLEAMARALFKSWFIDFDPVIDNALIAGNAIPAQFQQRAQTRKQRLQDPNTPKLPDPTRKLFPNSFQDSPLGPIPKGWKSGTLGKVAEHPRRGVSPAEIDNSTPYIGLEHMPRRSISLVDWGTAASVNSNKSGFRRGEFLFGKLRPYFHKVGVAPIDGVCSTDIVVVRPRAKDWSAFVIALISSPEFVAYTNAGSTGTKMPRTSWGEMQRYEISLPPETLAQAFDSILRPAIERIISGIHESRALAALRDTLLPKLISGELRLENPERFLTEDR